MATDVIQVTNVSPSATSEQMKTLFTFLGKIDELRLFPSDESPLPVTSRVCFVKFHEADSVGVAQHLTNTVFIDRALIVVPYTEGVIPDEAKALSLLAPANAVAGLLPGAGLLPTPNPLTSLAGVPLAATLGNVNPGLDPTLAALGLPGSNLNSQVTADQLLKLITQVDPKLNHAAGTIVSPALKSDTSSKDIEEAMKRVKEAQSLISAAIETDKKEEKRKHSRSRSRSRRRRTRSRSRHRRSRSRSRRRSHSKSRSRRRSRSPRRRRSRSRERRRSRSISKPREKKKEEKKRSKTPPKSYSTTRRSRSTSSFPIGFGRERRRRRSRSISRSPKKSRSPKRKLSRSPSPRRHKKEKKKDKDRDRSRDADERERSTSKKKKSKDKEREKEREKKAESEKGDVKVTRDYDEEEQGYDSEKERKEERRRGSDSGMSPKLKELAQGSDKANTESGRESKVNGDDHHEEDMDMSE
ncbi:serine/arginine-rich splicing factor 11 isoform X5 [Callorhinchus milii]|uniref:serine/arginine-rich splicing factor 11 isoform X5 n=1 Tax=Callorhinchus milii TaxID=7868 RepID=UPI0004574777|nr:serine/arginine-rich splicing factor 11 isoform X5 [Callorhinchus milii]|eukprot:gi/632981500/ref/XP_007907627.1/ PREDICTED: serine/arginine-rich splicing factor 11 isoform X2 [Callorhinchus milii]